MKTRSTILSLAALATLSLSALAPTQASAWGMHGGFGGGHFGGGHFGGYGGYHNWGGYGGYRNWSGYGYGWRPYFRPSYASYGPPVQVAVPVQVPVPVQVAVPVQVPAPIQMPVPVQAVPVPVQPAAQ
jgi:hypothetical protein